MLAKALNLIRPARMPRQRWLWVVLIPLTLHRKGRRLFYDGPACFNYPGRRLRYRSPTVLMNLWLRAAVHLWLTPLGRLVLALTAFAVLMGAASMLMPAHVLAMALVALLTTDLAVGFLTRPRLTVRRHLPQLVPANHAMTATYAVRNRGRRACRDLAVDVLPTPDMSVRTAPSAIAHLPAGEAVTVTGELIPQQRGCLLPSACAVASTFPFHLWRWCSRSRTPAVPVYVYPDFRPLDSVPLPPAESRERGYAVPGTNMGGTGEFAGLREYRYGDSPRLLHARSWARLRQPMVKLFSEESRRRIAVIVDACSPRATFVQHLLRRRRSQRLEAGLYLAAAGSENLCRRGYHVDFFCCRETAAGEDEFIPGAAGTGQLQHILKMIAGVPNADAADFRPLSPTARAQLRQSCSALVIMLDWDQPRQAFIHELQQSGLALKTIRILPADAETPADAGCTVLDAGAVLDGRVTAIE